MFGKKNELLVGTQSGAKHPLKRPDDCPGQQVLMLEPKSLKQSRAVHWLAQLKRHVKVSSDTREAPKIRKR